MIFPWIALLLTAGPAFALGPGEVSFRLASGPKFVSDSNNCSGGDGPHAAYVVYAITNTSGSVLSGVTARLNGFGAQPGSIPNPPTAFTFAGGQAQTQSLGTLAAGETRHVYWYVAYPCHGAATHSVNASVTAGDDRAGTVTSTGSTLTSTSSISSNAGGLLSSLTLGNNAVVGQVVTADVTYLFGNIGNNDDFVYQPVGTIGWRADCFLLTRSQIQSAAFSSVIPAGVGSDLYFLATGNSTGSNQMMTVRYTFVYDCAAVSSTVAPYAAQKSGQGLKYSSNFNAPAATIGLPEATNPFAIAKAVSPTTLPTGSTGPVTYTVTVTNTSAIDATLSAITDVLPAGFSFGAISAASDLSAAKSASVPSAGATGTISFVGNPIPATDRYLIPANSSATLIYTANIANGTADGLYANSATGSVGESDTSTASATVRLGSPPVIGIAKQAGATVDNGDGTFTTPITLRVENLGAGALSNVQVSDDLEAAFPSPATFSVSNVDLGGLDAGDTPFDGKTRKQLLSGTQGLAAGVTATLSFDVTYDPRGRLDPFSNQASATATGTSDLSDDGIDPDPDGDAIPGESGEDDPTLIAFPAAPVLGIAKEAGAAVANGDGTFKVPITLYLENLGNVDLVNLQVSDDLGAAFPDGVVFSVSNVNRGALSAPATPFDGVSNTELLAGTDELPFGASAVISFDVTFDPNGEHGPFFNQASASATGTTDLSHAGTDPDPSGEGDPSESTATSIAFTNPVLGIAKRASAVQSAGEGQFQTTITLRVANLGNVPLANLQVSDDLSAIFPIGVAFSVSNVDVGELTPSVGYDGSEEVNLLAGTDTLAVGATALLSFDLTFQPNGAPGPFLNQAIASAAGGISDLSDNGEDPDPDGDHDPAESDPTPISSGGTPVVGIAKEAGAVTDHGDGTFTTTITLRVENLGTAPLANLQVSDDLEQTFASPVTFSVSDVNVGTLTPALPAFDGSSQKNLLAGTDALAVGVTAVLSFQVRFDPNGQLGPFLNQARASATGTADLSDSGEDPDADGDGNPDEPAENEPTEITFVPRPVIGIAKQASPATVNGNGTFKTTITLRVENLGNVDLDELQIVDDLGAALPAEVVFTVSNVDRGALTPPASAYNGLSQTSLLAGTDGLAVGATAQVSFDLIFDPNGAPGPFLNQASASATGTSDLSTDGEDADPSGDGDPGGEGEDEKTSIEFSAKPVIGIAKQAGAVQNNGDGSFTTRFTLVVENLGNVDLQQVQVIDNLVAAFPPPASFSVANVDVGELSSAAAAYDGAEQAELLSGTDSLAVGAVATLAFDVTFAPQGASGPFLNQARASATGTSDLSDSGSDPDPSGNGDPGDPGEDDPTPIAVDPADVTGRVFRDLNGNRVYDVGEPGEVGWSVELLDGAGNELARARSGAGGVYSLTGVPPGSGYRILFRHPVTQLVWGQLKDVSLLAGSASVDQNLPIDPSGVLYYEDSRTPAAGVRLRMVDAFGAPLPDGCLLPGQQGQVSGLDGGYRFDLQIGALGCPLALVEAEYRIELVELPPAASLSVATPPQPAPLDATTCPGDAIPGPPCQVQAQAGPPPIGDPQTYYLSFLLEPGDLDVVFNHIPLQGSSASALRLTKRAMRRQASVGDAIVYEIELENETAAALADLSLIDAPPAGFHFVPGSAVLIRTAGSPQALGGSGTRPVVFGGIDLAAAERALVRYALRVGANAVPGSYENTAFAENGGARISNRARAEVFVVADPLLEQSALIGKVFHDRDGDGFQDASEAQDVVLRALGGAGFVEGTTQLRRGGAESFESLADVEGESPLVRGIALGALEPRLSLAQAMEPQWVARVQLRGEAVPIAEVWSAGGWHSRLDALGGVHHTHRGAVAAGESAERLALWRWTVRVGGALWLYVGVQNTGVAEAGLPGVRVTTPDGIQVETDAFGRWHLAAVAAGRLERGRTAIAKVDPATLPAGARFTTANPRMVWITPGMMQRLSFGVRLPRTHGSSARVRARLEAQFFAGGRLREEYRPQLQAVADRLIDAGAGRVEVAGGEAEARAAREALDVLVAGAPGGVELEVQALGAAAPGAGGTP